MSGDGNFWVTQDQTEYTNQIRTLINGISRRTNDVGVPIEAVDEVIPLLDKVDTGDHWFGESIQENPLNDNTKLGLNLVQSEIYSFGTGGNEEHYSPYDFGLIRSALIAYSGDRVVIEPDVGEEPTELDNGTVYIKGPFHRAADQTKLFDGKVERFLQTVTGTWESLKDTGTTENPILYEGMGTLAAIIGTPSGDDSYLTHIVKQFADSSLIIDATIGSDPADDAVDRHALLTGEDGVLSSLGPNPATLVEPGSYDDDPSVSLTDVIDGDWVYARGVDTKPLWQFIDWSYPIALTIEGIPVDFTISAPSQQSIAPITSYLLSDDLTISGTLLYDPIGNIDDAVASFTAKADLRYAEEEGRIKASLFGARAHMSSYLDNQLILLEAKKQAEIADFEKQLQVEYTRQQLEAKLTYQRLEQQRQTREVELEQTNAQANLSAQTRHVADALQPQVEHQRLLLEKNIRERSLLIDAQRSNMEKDLRLADGELRRVISEAEIQLRGDSTKVDANAKVKIHNSQQEGQIGIFNAGEVTKANSAKIEAGLRYFGQKIDVLEAIYRTVVGIVNLKIQGLADTGAASSVLNNLINNNLKARDSYRNYEMAFEQTRYQLANSVAGGIAANTELKWKAQLQNIMVLKEALSAIGVAPMGTEHHPSGFEKITTGISAGGALASTVMNAVNLF